ncbi:MAG: hypothetical protein R2991_11680 [Thermoanaerobaculia bacterium]
MERNHYRLWKGGGPTDLVPPRLRLLGAHALDVVLTTRRKRPWLDEPELARLVLERALDEPGTAAIAVLPDRVLWMLDEWPDFEATMRSFRAQAGEYAEIYGAPEGRVWQRGFWYRPLAELEAVLARHREIVRAPHEGGLLERCARWPEGLSMSVDEEGRLLQCAVQSTRRESAGIAHGPQHPQHRDRGARRARG